MMKTRHAVEVLPDADSLAPRAAEWLIEQIEHAVAKRGRAVIALSGGSTPKALYELLATPPWVTRIDWSTLHVFWGDERFVAATDEARNARMTARALLDHVDIPASHVYAIPDDATPTPDDVDATMIRANAAAALYVNTLHAFYGASTLGGTTPFFDVMLLGLGEDGHTASLFPGTPALDEHDHWAVAVRTTNAAAPVRITMTYPLVQSTHAVLFLVSGAAKAAIAKRVLDGDETLPAARAQPNGGTLWMMDAAAAGR